MKIARTASGTQRGERGFALLIVFLMAAAIALMLYRQIPRVAFESQRDKEELLIEHGEQYKRGIQLYYVAFKKYPAKIEDLENTNNKRFLRRRFIDPMTGKDQWRLIHVDASGALTDSLVQKPAANANGTPGATTGAAGAGANPNGSTAAGFTAASGGVANNGGAPNNGLGNNGSGTANPNDPNQPPQVNAAVLRRPSDRPLVSPTGDPNNPVNNSNVDPNDPRYWPAITLAPATGAQSGTQTGTARGPAGQIIGQVGQTGAPGFQQGIPQPGVPSGIQQPGTQISGLPPGFQPVPVPGQVNPLQNSPVQNSGLTGQITGATLGQPGVTPTDPSVSNSQYPTGIPIPPTYPPQQGQTGFQGQAGFQGAAGAAISGSLINGAANPGSATPGAAGNSALNAINTLLTTPRQTPPPVPDATGSMNTGGLAGVASTYKGPSIKIYKERQKYNEWEFIFDLKSGLPGQQPPAAPTAAQSPTGQSPNGTGQTTGQGTGQNPTGQAPSTFAPSTTFSQPTNSSTTH
jgi:hypothetical protein